MRHIPLTDQRPDETWLKKADALLEELKKARTSAKRRKIIKKNDALWGELKPLLQRISHGKCWFSEAKDCFNHWEVEHYRPKLDAKDVLGTRQPGYWWLAFDWTNFRLCGNVGNRKKGTYFPLRAGCPRIPPHGDTRREDPLLLDPADESDPLLLSFNIEGRAIAAAHLSDPWEKERVRLSVERYNLDFGPLMDKRKVIWAECWNRIQEYLRDLMEYQKDQTNLIARDRYKQALKHVRAMMREDKELTAVARACVLSTGDPRVTCVLQSV